MNFLSEFKKDYLFSEGGKYNLEVQVPYLVKLAKHYQQKYLKTGDWTDCLRAHSLYNSASTRKPKKTKFIKNAYKIQHTYWKGTTSLRYKDHRRLTEKLKGELQSIREDVRKSNLDIARLVTKFDADHGSAGYNGAVQDLVKLSRDLSIKCSEKMVNFAGNIIKESVDILNERPPCAFSAVAIGSLARGEATPYSDMEYLFLIEKKTPQTIIYFQTLAMTSYFLIGNLGETKLKYLAIPELNGWFDDTAKNGFKIDGLGVGAGNIPTGNGSTDSENKFICTPTELFDIYMQMLNKPTENSLSGDLTAMMTYMKRIYGYEPHDMNLLLSLEDFIKSVTPNKVRRDVNMHMLRNDMDKFNFTPDAKLKDDQAYTVNVKSQLYRFPSILLFNLAIIYNVATESSWATADHLRKSGKISEYVYNSLTTQLACACYIRQSAYLYHDSHDDRISVADRCLQSVGEDNSSINKHGRRWYAPSGLISVLCQAMLPMKEHFANGGAVLDSLRELTDENLSKHSLIYRMKTLLFCGRYHQAYGLLEDYVPEISTLKAKSIIQRFESLGSHEIIGLIADVLWKNNKILVALKLNIHLNKVLANESTRLKIVKCHLKLSRNESALKILERCSQTTAAVLFLKGRVYSQLGRFDDAQTHILRSMHMYLTSASMEPGCDSYGSGITLEDLSKRNPLDILSKVRNFSTDVTKCLKVMGDIFWKQKKHDLAEAYDKVYRKSIRSLYGNESVVPAAASALNDLGVLNHERQRYDKAAEYYKRSLNMFEKIYGVDADHATIHLLLTNLAKNCRLQNQHDETKKFYLKRLHIYETSNSAETSIQQQIDIAKLLKCLAINSKDLEKDKEASKYDERSLTLFESIYGKDSKHIAITGIAKQLRISAPRRHS